jgi:hypothetical protein
MTIFPLTSVRQFITLGQQLLRYAQHVHGADTNKHWPGSDFILVEGRENILQCGSSHEEYYSESNLTRNGTCVTLNYASHLCLVQLHMHLEWTLQPVVQCDSAERRPLCSGTNRPSSDYWTTLNYLQYADGSHFEEIWGFHSGSDWNCDLLGYDPVIS